MRLSRACLPVCEACYFGTHESTLDEWVDRDMINLLISRPFIECIIKVKSSLLNELSEINFQSNLMNGNVLILTNNNRSIWSDSNNVRLIPLQLFLIEWPLSNGDCDFRNLV